MDNQHARRLTLSGLLAATLCGCAAPPDPLSNYEPMTPATLVEAPMPGPLTGKSFDPADVAQGKYLVELLGCGSCHTDGALVGRPDKARRLAGSSIGIAYSNPLQNKHPGVVYPANLTPDPDTGLGSWNEEQIVKMIRTGVNRHGDQQLAVMPWPAYAKISDQDARAIAAYLQSLAPVNHRTPRNVEPGNKASSPYVHFGVYRTKQ